MAGLGDTTAGLAALRKAMTRSSGAGDDAGMTEVQGFGSNPGALRMLAYAPQGLAPGAPLVVVLHGCAQRAGAYARSAGWLALAERFGFAVLAPEQRGENNPNRCFNWFEPNDVARDLGEAASIHAMSQHMARTHGLDPAQVFVTGLSAGGAMTAALLATYPEAFAAGAVVAGLPFGVARNAQEAFASMHGGVRRDGRDLGGLVAQAAPTPERWPRLAIWHGLADPVVVSDNALALARQWAAVHQRAEAADEVQARDGWTRSVWRGADGDAIIEMNLLSGLGHGAPLAAGGDDPIGEPGAFMLEASVSSSLEIARFWGLAPPETAAKIAAWSAVGPASDAPGPREHPLGDKIMAAVSPHVAKDVQRVIAKALRAAGLMR
jgi:poly(hydroxyalkanoate) depolymerase family esterase